MAVFLLWRDGEPVVRSALLGMSIAAFGAMLARRRWRRSLNARARRSSSAAPCSSSRSLAQPNGTDLWYYQMYGRIVGAAATAAVAIAAAGGRSALQPPIDARSRANSVTPWNVFRPHGVESFRGTVTDLGPVAHSIPTLALVAALVLGACVVASYIRDEEPGLVVGGALAAWLVVALYTSPWSGFWVIPALALRRRALATRLVVAWFCLLMMQTFWGSMTALYAFTGDPHATTYQHINAALISASIAGAVVIAAALGADALVRLRAAGSPRLS
jgi:hypothetical protein